MRRIIEVLQQVLAWITVAQGTVQMIPIVDAQWKDDFMELTNRIVREITIFIETHPAPASQVARGYAATVALVSSVLSRIDLLVASTAPKAERLAQAEALAAILSDPAQVYQAKKGDDANALNGGKAAALRRIDAIKQQ